MESKKNQEGPSRQSHPTPSTRGHTSAEAEDIKSTLITAHCLVCRRLHDISAYRLKQILCIRTAEDIACAFKILQNLVLTGNYTDNCAASDWDFDVECLPLCPTCTRTLFHIEKLKKSLDQIQSELNQVVGHVRRQIFQSNKQQTEDNRVVDNRIDVETEAIKDERVDRFRNLVIRQWRANLGLEPVALVRDVPEKPFDISLILMNEDHEDEPGSFEEAEFLPQELDTYANDNKTLSIPNEVSHLSSTSTTRKRQVGLECRKNRAARLLQRFKERNQEREAARNLRIMKPEQDLDTGLQLRPKRKASLRCLRKNQSKLRRAHSESDNSFGCEDSVSSESDESSSIDNSDCKGDWNWRAHRYAFTGGVPRCRVNPKKKKPPKPMKPKKVKPPRPLKPKKEKPARPLKPKRDKIGRPYAYEKRDGSFYYKDVQFTQLKLESESGSVFVCSICSLKLKNTSSMMHHINIHTGKYPLICEFCTKGFTWKNKLEQHIQTKHSGKVIPCDICGKSFISTRGLQNHKYTHMNKEELDAAVLAGEKLPKKKPYSRRPPESHQCSQCGKIYSTAKTLEDHVGFAHLGKTVPCKYENCEELFTTYDKLKQHLLYFHEELKRNYDCPECQKVHTCASMLKKHMIASHNIGKKPHQCDVCLKEFIDRGKLNSHLKVHSDFRSFQCDQCEKSYKKRHPLLVHQRKHHSN